MKHIKLQARSTESYIKYYSYIFGVKPQVSVPFQVPLEQGGYLEFEIDENMHALRGEAQNLTFTTDRLEADPDDRITGKLQKMSLRLGNLDLRYDPKTGEIYSGGGSMYIQGLPAGGGAGSWPTDYLGPSKLLDGNSASFDLSNGLGWNGGMVLELGPMSQAENSCKTPADFVLHLDTVVEMEDVDGDGKYEAWSPWRYMKILSRPPELKVIWPEVPRPLPPNPWVAGIYEIKVSDLLEMATEGHGTQENVARITRVVISNGSKVGVLVTNQNGVVLSGDISERSTKTIEINPRNHNKLTLGLLTLQRAWSKYSLSMI